MTFLVFSILQKISTGYPILKFGFPLKICTKNVKCSCFNITFEYKEAGKMYRLIQSFLSETKDHSAFAAIEFMKKAVELELISALFTQRDWVRWFMDCAKVNFA